MIDISSTGKLYTFWIFERKKTYYVCQLTEKRGYNHLKGGFGPLKGKITEE
jgi:hypothetical protein